MERTIRGEDIVSVLGKVTVKLGDDDFLHLDNKDLEHIFDQVEMDIAPEKTSGAGVPRQVKKWLLTLVTPISEEE